MSKPIHESHGQNPLLFFLFFCEKTPREGGCEAGDVGRKGNLSDPSLSSLPNGRTGDLVRLRGMLSSLGPVDIGHMVDIDSWYQWINQNQPWYGVIFDPQSTH